MTDPTFPNRVRAYDRADEFDDVLHYIHKFPDTIPASRIRPQPGETERTAYVWEDHMDINPTTGEVTVNRLPNMEEYPEGGVHKFPFVVAATDGLNVTLQDVMFNVAHVIEKPYFPTQTAEWTVTEGTNFSRQFVAIDPEPGGVLTFSVTGLTGFTMSSDGVLSGIVPPNATTVVQDKAFSVVVSSSASGQSNTLPCVFHIVNNNQGPVWSSPPIYNVQPGPWSAQLVAGTMDGTVMKDREGEPVTFTIEVGAPAGFEINGYTISRTFDAPVFPENTATYPLVVTASSGTGSRLKKTNQIINVIVTDFPNDPPVWVTPAGSIGGGEGGSTFSYQLEATDTELVTYNLASGALPPGLTLAGNGLISGTLPQVSQGSTPYAFTINATDGENVVPRSFSISSNRTNNPPAWSTAAGLLLDVWAGQPFDLQLAAADPEGAALSYTITKPSTLSWLNMNGTGRISGRVPIDAAATTANLRFTVNVSDGVHVVPREFQVRVKRLAPQTINFTANAEWVVPEGCYQIMLTWVVGGGGGGGAGHELGNGGGGAGGGSGGFVRYVPVDVVPGDRLELRVGAGGVGFSGGQGVMGYGGNGGITKVLKNGVEVSEVSGGKGGGTSPNFNGGYLPSVPGAGGTPNGIDGVAGQTGTSDRASCYGGAGAHGPLIGAQAGAGGAANGGSDYINGPGAGKPGVGPGSSGGGGGSQDRVNSSRNYWKGGNGQPGFIEFTFPSQGPTGGTAPWEAAPVNTNNYISFFGPAAGSDMQDNYLVDQPSLNYNVGSGGGQVSSVAVEGSGIWEVWTGTNYTGTMITVDGANPEYHIGSFKGISHVGSARRQASGGGGSGGGTGGGSGSPNEQQVITPADFGAKVGSDSTTALANMFAEAKASGAIVDLSAKVVYTATTIKIPDGIVFQGCGTTFRADGSLTNEKVFITLGKNLRVPCLTVTSPGTRYSFYLLGGDCSGSTFGAINLSTDTANYVKGSTVYGSNVNITSITVNNLYEAFAVNKTDDVHCDNWTVGTITIKNYRRGFSTRLSSNWTIDKITADTMHPLAVYGPGANGILLEGGLNNFKIKTAIIEDACEHAVRMGGGSGNTSTGIRFDYIRSARSGGCALKLNPGDNTGIITDFSVGTLEAVDIGKDTWPGGNKETLRANACVNVTIDRIITKSEQYEYAGGALLQLNDIDGLTIGQVDCGKMYYGVCFFNPNSDSDDIGTYCRNISVNKITINNASENIIGFNFTSSDKYEFKNIVFNFTALSGSYARLASCFSTRSGGVVTNSDTVRALAGPFVISGKAASSSSRLVPALGNSSYKTVSLANL